jgi:hypothetical protein
MPLDVHARGNMHLMLKGKAKASGTWSATWIDHRLAWCREHLQLLEQHDMITLDTRTEEVRVTSKCNVISFNAKINDG